MRIFLTCFTVFVFFVSCNDKTKDFDLAYFHVEIDTNDKFYSQQEGNINFIVKIPNSDQEQQFKLRAMYRDDKASTLSAGGKIINPREYFMLEGKSEEIKTYIFKSDVVGTHNLEFYFFNSDNYSRKYNIEITVDENL